MADRATTVLRVILAGTIAISIVHYADNTIRYDVYTGGEWSFVARWMIPVGWALFTAAGIAGYLAFRAGSLHEVGVAAQCVLRRRVGRPVPLRDGVAV